MPVLRSVKTINVGRDASIREITLEVRDKEHAETIQKMLNELEGVEVLWTRDRALLRHEGGKLVIESTRPVRTVLGRRRGARRRGAVRRRPRPSRRR